MEENIFENIKKENIILPLQMLENFTNTFNKTFEGKLVFEVKSAMENNNDLWAGIGEALQEKEEKNMVVRANIVAPTLNGYKLLVLKLVYKISQVYPCRIYNILENQSIDCKESGKVQNELKKIFTSESFQKPVRMLLAQV